MRWACTWRSGPAFSTILCRPSAAAPRSPLPPPSCEAQASRSKARPQARSPDLSHGRPSASRDACKAIGAADAACSAKCFQPQLNERDQSGRRDGRCDGSPMRFENSPLIVVTYSALGHQPVNAGHHNYRKFIGSASLPASRPLLQPRLPSIVPIERQ